MALVASSGLPCDTVCKRISPDAIQHGFSVANIEDALRKEAAQRQVAVVSYFSDFDKLNSGYVTREQFYRCVNRAVGWSGTPEEEGVLASAYDRGDGMIDYHSFSRSIQPNFDPKDFSGAQTEAKIIKKSHRTTLPMPSESVVTDVLRRLSGYFRYHGIDPTEWWADYDKNKEGAVTESQFVRAFPSAAAVVTSNDMDLLVEKYRDASRPNMCNYLQFVKDLAWVTGTDHFTTLSVTRPIRREIQDARPVDVLAVLKRLEECVYRHGIRARDFFRDYDRHKMGVISRGQFLRGLILALGEVAQLTFGEAEEVADHFADSSGAVNYNNVCNLLDNVHLMPHLDKRPGTDTPHQLPRGDATPALLLSDSDNTVVDAALKTIADYISRRRLFLLPFLQDFDTGHKLTQTISPTHFRRVLLAHGIPLSDNDFRLITQRFGTHGGGFLYLDFMKAVDPEYKIRDEQLDCERKKKQMASLPAPETIPNLAASEDYHFNMDRLIDKIRRYVATNPIKLADFFQDYDSLNSGLISAQQFLRSLNLAGFNDMRSRRLADDEANALVLAYASSRDPYKVDWRRFVRDVEATLQPKHLEKDPTAPPGHPPPSNVPSCRPFDTSKLVGRCNDTLNKIIAKVNLRRMLVRPTFNDFDKLNSGHVTINQFRQCMGYLDFGLTENELYDLEQLFGEEKGFNYLQFLDLVDPVESEEAKYDQLVSTLTHLNKLLQSRQLMEKPGCVDVNDVLNAIKNKVHKERPKIRDLFVDYDPLRHGVISKSRFRRALVLMPYTISNADFDLLCREFQSPSNPEMIDYNHFCDVIETTFTIDHLDKNPHVSPVRYQLKPVKDEERPTPGVGQGSCDAMCRLAQKIYLRSLDLQPLFSDFDKVSSGKVTQTQFRRVLRDLDLARLLSENDLDQLFHYYKVRSGGADLVDYRTFLTVMDNIIREQCVRTRSF